MLYITGDTHGMFERFSSRSFPEGKHLTKDDYVIILGDFGGIWDVNKSSKAELYDLQWLEDKPFTILFIDGNHENFERLPLVQDKGILDNILYSGVWLNYRRKAADSADDGRSL